MVNWPGLLGGGGDDVNDLPPVFSGKLPTRQEYMLGGAVNGIAPMMGWHQAPVSLGQALAGLAGGVEAGQRQWQKDGLQLAGLQQKMRQHEAIQKYAEALPEAERGAFLVDPAAYIKAKNEGYTLGEGQKRFQGGQVVAEGPEKKPWEGAVKGPDGQWVMDPNYLRGRTAIAAAGRSVTNTNIINKQEGEEAKTVGKAYGEMFIDTQKAALDAQRSIANIDRLSNLLEQVNTGKGAATTLELKRMAKGAGIDLEKYGIRDDVAPAEAAQALSGEIALQLRNPAGGAGMPGAMSDADREFLRSMTPGIETTPEGRRLMMETTRRVNQRHIDVARLAREYRAKNGTVDEGFFNQLQQYSAANPLFRDLVSNVPDPSKWQAVPIPNDLRPPSAGGRPGAAQPGNPYSGMSSDDLSAQLRARGLLK